jgi:hypothetical protein
MDLIYLFDPKRFCLGTLCVHAKDAETWYRAQPFFCKKRWAKILKVMGAGKGSPQQLALL